MEIIRAAVLVALHYQLWFKWYNTTVGGGGGTNSGGGGGGGGHGKNGNSGTWGGAGGSGVVIIGYRTNQLTTSNTSNRASATGGTQTISGMYATHEFTSTGNFVPHFDGDVEVMVVAGGGSTALV